MNKDIYVNDLKHRFSGYDFVETLLNGRTTVEFQDGGAVIVAEATNIVVVDAYRRIRQQMVEGENIPPFRSTSAQRDALTGIDDSIIIQNDDTLALEHCLDGVWYSVAGTTPISSTTVQTTDATPTDIDEYTLVNNEVRIIEISVVGIEEDAPVQCGVVKSAVVYDDGVGAVILGSVALILEEYSDSNWDVDITVAQNKVKATVTCVAATTIDWTCKLQFIE